MIRHEKLDKMADLDKFFAKAKLRLEDIQIVHVSTKMAGFYMVFYDDGLPYPEKSTAKHRSDADTEHTDDDIVLNPVDKSEDKEMSIEEANKIIEQSRGIGVSSEQLHKAMFALAMENRISQGKR